LAVRSQDEEDWMSFRFKLELQDGSSAEPPSITSAVPNMRPGDTIPLGADKALRVVQVRDDDADQPPVLVVEVAAQVTRPAAEGSEAG
jgi:hypothetical protein